MKQKQDSKFNDTIVASLGCRYFSVDYSANNPIFDISMRGAILGIGFGFQHGLLR